MPPGEGSLLRLVSAGFPGHAAGYHPSRLTYRYARKPVPSDNRTARDSLPSPSDHSEASIGFPDAVLAAPQVSSIVIPAFHDRAIQIAWPSAIALAEAHHHGLIHQPTQR